MEPLPVDILQLQRRDPSAWSALLAREPETDGVIVTAVTSEPLWSTTLTPPGKAGSGRARARRFVLTLAGVSDPVSYIAKQTNATEALIYRLHGNPPGTAFPTCRYVHLDGDNSWVILDDIPHHFPPRTWTAQDADNIVAILARLHGARWECDVSGNDRWLGPDPIIPHFHHRAEGAYSWGELLPYRRDRRSSIGHVDRKYLSGHAIQNAGRMAPLFLEAAYGLGVMHELGGWPGVIDDSHLAIVAELLDDPVPVIAPLLDLPATLLHGLPHPGHWRLTLLDEHYLIDWSQARIGPPVWDLAAFLGCYPLIADAQPEDGRYETFRLSMREMTPLAEETIIDSYMLALSAELGSRSAARALRTALPAARCLWTLLTWFTFFASWADDMPDRSDWQRAHRRIADEHHLHANAPSAGMQAYLSWVFARFKEAYRNL